MKNKYISFVALAAAALATSCVSDDLAEQKQEQNQKGTHTVTLTASVNEGQTRVGMTKKDNTTASFYWHKNDQIFVQTVNNGNYSGAAFSIKDGDAKKDGATSATFTGEVTGTVGTYAVYPYSESQKHSFTGATALTYNLPATYTYNKVETNIFSKTTDGTTTYPSNPTNMPMLGTITGDNGSKKISFKCLGGLAVIRIDQMPATEGTLKVTADQQLSGNFTVSDLSATDAQIATTAASDGNGKVTFKFSNASTTSAGVFYLPLATGSYSGVTIEISSTSNATATSTINYGTLDVSRASVTAIGLYNENGKIYAKDADGKYIIDGHKFVDLGLSVLWAETNIGAEKAEDYGNYYAWGEVTAYDEVTDCGTTQDKKTNYSWSTYKWTTTSDGSSFTKYTTDGKTVLDKEDDAAYVNWGSSCRMPTKAEFEELLDKTNNCTWSWTTENNVNGHKVTGIKSSYTNNSIFLPTSGFRNGENSYKQGSISRYWSSSLNPSNSRVAYSFIFTSTSQNSYDLDRFLGHTVRPVAEKP